MLSGDSNDFVIWLFALQFAIVPCVLQYYCIFITSSDFEALEKCIFL